MKNQKLISTLLDSVVVSRAVIDSDSKPTLGMLMHNQIFIMEGLAILLKEVE